MLLLLRVHMAVQTFGLPIEQFIAAAFWLIQLGCPGEIRIELGREGTDLLRTLIGGNRLRHLIESELYARPISRV